MRLHNLQITRALYRPQAAHVVKSLGTPGCHLAQEVCLSEGVNYASPDGVDPRHALILGPYRHGWLTTPVLVEFHLVVSQKFAHLLDLDQIVAAQEPHNEVGKRPAHLACVCDRTSQLLEPLSDSLVIAVTTVFGAESHNTIASAIAIPVMTENQRTSHAFKKASLNVPANILITNAVINANGSEQTNTMKASFMTCQSPLPLLRCNSNRANSIYPTIQSVAGQYQKS